MIKASNSVKIIICDPLDDTVPHFQSTMAGIGSLLGKYNYDTEDFRHFFKSLQFLFKIEDQLYNENDWGHDEYICEVVSSVKYVEENMKKQATKIQTLSVEQDTVLDEET